MRNQGLMLIGAFLAGLLAFAAPDARAQERIRPDACIRDLSRSVLEGLDPANAAVQAQVADLCHRASATARGVEAARARFYAGRAYRLAGNVDEAIRQLEIAVNLGQDFQTLFSRELRSARLILVQAYQTKGRIEAARNLLNDPGLNPNDPAVAYQRALLILAELGEAGEEGAFDALKTVFVQDDARLLGKPGDPVQLSPADVRSGRSWLYRLGVTLGQRALALQARDPLQRRADAQRAVDYLRPALDAVNAACPDPGPIECASGIAATESIGVFAPKSAPTSEDLLNVSFQIGVAYLKAAGLQEAQSGQTLGGDIGGVGALDCFGSQLAPDAERHFRNARFAFDAYTRRSSASAASAADARWGLACTILANLPNVSEGRERQRQLAQAIEQLVQAPNRPATYLTLARAQVLQGQSDSARESFKKALNASGDTKPCPTGAFELNTDNRFDLPSQIYLDMARTRFAPDRTGPDLFDRAIAEVEAARPGSLSEAEADLRCAVHLNGRNVEARLTLGHVYLRLGTDRTVRPLDAPPFNKAFQALSYFERPPSDNPDGRAEGLFLLSKRLTLTEQHRVVGGETRPTNDKAYRALGAQAVTFAAQAYSLTQRPAYRRQACQGQILFGEVSDQNYCSASGQGADRAEGFFYEGLYWLRRGQREAVPERLKSWSRSIQSFNRGVAATQAGQTTPSGHASLPAALDLRALLTYGQRYVLRCTGLDDGDTDSASNDVKSFYWLSGIPRKCGGPPS